VAASYPSQVVQFTDHKNTTEVIDASHPNNIQYEVMAIEGAIGATPTTNSNPTAVTNFSFAARTPTTISARIADVELGVVSDAHTQYLRKAGDAANIITASSASITGLVIKGAASQSANLQEWQNSSGTVVTSINASGALVGYVPTSTVTTKGDLIVATGSGAVARQAAGADGYVLVADSTQTNGIKWASASSSATNGLTITASTGTLTVPNSTLAFAGIYNTTITSTAATAVTLPTSGTLANTSSSTFTGTSTWNGATIGVGYGGLGATNLTGYLYGNGASAVGASSTIPGSAISGNITGNAANVSGTVAVANGGTGASTLSGFLYGNGTSAVTASTSIQVGSAPTGSNYVRNIWASSSAPTGGSDGEVWLVYV